VFGHPAGRFGGFLRIPKNGHAHTNMSTAKLSDVAIENANPKQKPYL